MNRYPPGLGPTGSPAPSRSPSPLLLRPVRASPSGAVVDLLRRADRRRGAADRLARALSAQTRRHPLAARATAHAPNLKIIQGGKQGNGEYDLEDDDSTDSQRWLM